jgi:hypothetical protein
MTYSNELHFFVTAEHAVKKRAEDAKTIRATVFNIENFLIELSVFALRPLRLCGEKRRR